jgi:hypothetical protein
MDPEAVRQQVLQLVTRLQSGALAGLGPVDLGDGMLLDAAVAARVIIAEARHLALRIENGDPVSPWRWRLIENQLERLHLAIQ